MLADRLVVIDAGQRAAAGTARRRSTGRRATRGSPTSSASRTVSTDAGSGRPTSAGWGWLRWAGKGGDQARTRPLLKVRDKGRLPAGQQVTWVVPGDGIHLRPLAISSRSSSDDSSYDGFDGHGTDGSGSGGRVFAATISEARFLGEITLVSLVLDSVPDLPMKLTLAGPQRRDVAIGARVGVELDLQSIHVMPVRNRDPAAPDPAAPDPAASDPTAKDSAASALTAPAS